MVVAGDMYRSLASEGSTWHDDGTRSRCGQVAALGLRSFPQAINTYLIVLQVHCTPEIYAPTSDEHSRRILLPRSAHPFSVLSTSIHSDLEPVRFYNPVLLLGTHVPMEYYRLIVVDSCSSPGTTGIMAAMISLMLARA